MLFNIKTQGIIIQFPMNFIDALDKQLEGEKKKPHFLILFRGKNAPFPTFAKMNQFSIVLHI